MIQGAGGAITRVLMGRNDTRCWGAIKRVLMGVMTPGAGGAITRVLMGRNDTRCWSTAVLLHPIKTLVLRF